MKRTCERQIKTDPSTEEVPKESSHTVDHLDQIIVGFSNLYWSEDFSDVELVVNGTVRLKAHRVVLSLSSDVFRQMFSGGCWQESGQQEVHLTEDESCLQHMDPFLQYFYTGTMAIDAENLFPLLVLTDKYNVSALRQSCEQFALRNVSAGSVGRALAWWRSAERVNFRELEEACTRYVALNAPTIISSSEWLTLELDRLCTLLDSADLVVESEFQLFLAVKRWITQNKAKRPEKILKHVRFPLMSPLDVYDPSLADTLPADINRIFLAESSLIYQVNSLPMEAIGLYHDIHAPSFTMRLYTSADFGCPRKIENVNNYHGVCVEFTVKLFQSKTSWKITSQCFCDTYYEDPPPLQHSWTCRLNQCNLTDSNHYHQLCVLMYKSIAGSWFVCHYETFDVPHNQDVPLGELMKKFEKQHCLHKNTALMHFVGKTRWAKST